ncbi:hypothetical protein QQS21_003984 [Conoideocrella luteorostrata]|uniref:HMG box domain-containing protein n=1 Tax=Conoideocrella luteorostrata TaxID=1105319 RepID=A0AAJ0CVB5_9HYPO|nr:hypothetical protein QQS21_003984 [Conoideocrella luteorostrata]
MLTAIGRAAARRVLFSSSRPSASKLATQLPQRSVSRPNATVFAVARPLTVSAWMRSPVKGSAGGSKAKKATGAKTKKSPAKKKPVAKKKKKPASAAAKKPKKAKKTLTPEEKDKAELRELKKMALLKGPALLPETGWAVYVADNVTAGQGKLTDKIKEVAESFAALSVSEKESLKSKAVSNHNANKDTRQKWITSYPEEAIYMANIARRRIARKLDKSRLYLIHDDRLPKRAGTAYTLFIKSRFSQANSGTASGTAQDTFRAMSEEWRSMSESEKQPFKDEAAKEVETSQAKLKELKEKARAYWKAQKGPAGQVPS